MMDYDKLKEMLINPNSNIWVNGKKVGLDKGVVVWEYDFGGMGSPHVVIRGVDSNNPQLQFASTEYGVFIDGKKLNLDKMQYLNLFEQAGYLYAVVQPEKLKHKSITR